MADIQCAISNNRQMVKIILVDDDGKDIGEHIATVETLDLFIQELSRVRIDMQPPISRILPPSPVFKNVTRETTFHVNRQHKIGRELFLGVRHPGFGWLAFVMDRNHAVDLCGLLQREVNSISPVVLVKKPEIIT